MPIGCKKKSPNLGSQSLTAGSYRPINMPASRRTGTLGYFALFRAKIKINRAGELRRCTTRVRVHRWESVHAW